LCGTIIAAEVFVIISKLDKKTLIQIDESAQKKQSHFMFDQVGGDEAENPCQFACY